MSLWERMERQSPEARMIRAEGRLSLEERSARADRMAANIMASQVFVADVGQHVERLLSSSRKEQEMEAAGILARHPDAIPDIVEDEEDKLVLILQVARRIQNMRSQAH